MDSDHFPDFQTESPRIVHEDEQPRISKMPEVGLSR